MPLLRHWLGGASSLRDGLGGPPEGDYLTQWIQGVVFPAIIGIASIVLLVRQNYGFGTFVASLGTFLHFHYFWGLTEKYGVVSFVGKNIAALGMILCFAYGMYVFIFRM